MTVFFWQRCEILRFTVNTDGARVVYLLVLVVVICESIRVLEYG